jgi:peptidoglycan hydrolase-like protein with peptidoglycan-binding domain
MRIHPMVKRILTLALFSFFCAGLTFNVFAQAAAVKEDRLVTIPMSETPPEVVMVISAIVLEMRGEAHPKGDWPEVVFTPGVTDKLREPRFNYVGFHLLQTIVNDYQPSAQDPRRANLKGHLHFLDGFGRRTLVGFEAEYKLTEKGISVNYADVKPIYPYRPEVRLFVVPGEKLSNKVLEKFSNNALTFDFVAKNAVPASHPELIPKGVRDYYVFAFFMDRLGPDDITDLIISRTREGMAGTKVDLKTPEVIPGTGAGDMHLDHNGWHMVVLRGEFSLTGPEIFFKAIFQPGRKDTEPSLGEPVLAGLFSTKLAGASSEPPVEQIQRALTERGYDPGPADGTMGKLTHQAIQKFQRDQKLVVDGKPSSALLEILKAPGHTSAVMLAQLALIQRGYNPGIADGIMGMRTRKAIQQFQQDHGLEADGKLRVALLAKMAGFGERPAVGKMEEHPSSAKTSVELPGPETFPTENIAVRNRLKAKMWPNHIQRP